MNAMDAGFAAPLFEQQIIQPHIAGLRLN